MEFPQCDLCHSGLTSTIFRGREWQQAIPEGLQLVKCQQCGLVFLKPRPSADEINEYYPSDYEPFRPALEDEHSSLMRWMRRRKLIRRRKIVEAFSGCTSGRLLDVGCSTGLFIHEMAIAGWKVTGIEPVASAADYAQTRLGLKVFRGTIDQMTTPSDLYDVVTFWDVLEHTFSPTIALQRAAELLVSNGLVIINVPNFRSLDRLLFGPFWIGYDPPRHLYVFSRTTLTALLKKAGFEPLAWRSFMPSYFPFSLSLERKLQSLSPHWARKVGRILRQPGMRLPFEPWFTIMNWLGISSLITVIAKKAESFELVGSTDHR